MTTKNTPGPLKKVEGDHGLILEGRARGRVVVIHPDGDATRFRHFATVYGTDDNEDENATALVSHWNAHKDLLAVLTHLVRLIQESPDVRYYVGGRGTQMRELLCTAIAAVGFKGDPAEALKPAEHRRNDLPERERLMRRLEDLASKGRGE